MKNQFFSIALAMLLLGAGHSWAATYTWDGTTDTDWFGANWTVGGSSGQLAPDEDGGNNAKRIDYVDDTFNVTGATIDNFATGTGAIYFHGASDVNIDSSSIHLYPNLWLPTKVLDTSTFDATNSTLRFTRGNNNGNAFVIGDSASPASTPAVTISGTQLTVDQFRSQNNTFGNGDFEMFANGTFDMTSGSTLIVDNQWQIDDSSVATASDSSADVGLLELYDDGELNLDNVALTINNHIDVNNSSVINITGDTQIDTPYLRIDSNNASVNLTSGHIDLENNNPLRGSSGFGGDFDFVGLPGEVTVTQNNTTDTTRNLIFKTWQGFFSIDGVRINPSSDGVVPGSTGVDVSGFNAYLATQAVNGKHFEFTGSTDGTGDITLNLVAVVIPEPASAMMLGLATSLLALRRRS